MPYTPAQRRLFHEIAENPDAARRHGVSRKEGQRLANEADKLAREGKEKREKKSSDLGSLPVMQASGAQITRQMDQVRQQIITNPPTGTMKGSFVDLSRVFGRK
jgi:hypothetical protein